MRDPWLSLAQSCPLPLVWWAASRLKLELDDQDSDWDRDRDTSECWCLDPGGLTLLQSPLTSDNLLRHQDIFSQAMSQAMRWQWQGCLSSDCACSVICYCDPGWVRRVPPHQTWDTDTGQWTIANCHGHNPDIKRSRHWHPDTIVTFMTPDNL